MSQEEKKFDVKALVQNEELSAEVEKAFLRGKFEGYRQGLKEGYDWGYSSCRKSFQQAVEDMRKLK